MFYNFLIMRNYFHISQQLPGGEGREGDAGVPAAPPQRVPQEEDGRQVERLRAEGARRQRQDPYI